MGDTRAITLTLQQAQEKTQDPAIVLIAQALELLAHQLATEADQQNSVLRHIASRIDALR